MILKQRFSDGKTEFIDIGNNFVILTPASKEWVVDEKIISKDAHSIISYCDYQGKLQHEYLYKDFLQWLYSNDGQLFLNLTSHEHPKQKVEDNGESNFLKMINEMCEQSLHPEAFHKWEEVRDELKRIRKNLK